jgi:Polymer-forming cytoskeletal
MRALRTQRTLPTGRRRAATIRAGGTLILLSVGLLLSFAGPARAQTSGDGGGAKPYVVLTGKLDVPEGTTYREVVIFDGPLTIEGTVTKDAVAFNGDVVVTGRVNGNVFALNGRVTVKRGASVGGDVTSDRTPLIAPGTVTGVVQTTTHVDLGSLTFVGRFFVWLAATGTSFLLGLILTLLLPKAADAVAWTGRDRLGPAAAWGVGLSILVPVAAAFLVFTVVGTLLGLGVLFALLLLASIGYAAGALCLGRWILKPPKPRFVAFLLGWAILRGLALIPILGGFLFILASLWGIGAIVVAAFVASHDRGTSGAAGTPPAPAEVPPTPPMPTLP